MKTFLLLSGLSFWTLFVAMTSLRPGEPAASSSTPGPARKATLQRGGDRTATKPAPAAMKPDRIAAAHESIGAAVLRYEPSAVHEIRPWLLDADPEVRRAARDGLVQLGESDAIPHLRYAASRLEDTAEIASLHEAADLLSLPAWSDSEDARQAVAEIAGEFAR
jgi:hypothetical protein